MIVVLAVLIIFVMCLLSWIGVDLCNEGKYLGVVLLFITLNLLGLLIGLGLIYNHIKNKEMWVEINEKIQNN